MGFWARHAAIGAMAAAMLTLSIGLETPVGAASTDLSMLTDGADKTLECVPYARTLSGIEIYGDAWTWWDQADGKYQRGHTPKEGAVLALGRSGVMQLGHVAVVSKVLNSRELLISHANWSGPGVVEQNVEAIDVSPDNDWSQVRVWYGPSGQMGSRVNPGLGFIYPKKSKLPGDHGPRFAKAQPAAPADPAPRKVPKLKVDRDIFLTEYAEVKKPSKKVRRTLDDAMADFMRGASTR